MSFSDRLKAHREQAAAAIETARQNGLREQEESKRYRAKSFRIADPYSQALDAARRELEAEPEVMAIFRFKEVYLATPKSAFIALRTTKFRDAEKRCCFIELFSHIECGVMSIKLRTYYRTGTDHYSAKCAEDVEIGHASPQVVKDRFMDFVARIVADIQVQK